MVFSYRIYNIGTKMGSQKASNIATIITLKSH